MKGDNIFDRLVKIGVQAIELAQALPSTPSAKHVGHQLVRSATSAGANYQEARGAESRNDFTHKLGVALKETREAHYWLRLVQDAGMTAEDRLGPLLRETQELTQILASSIRTVKTASPAVGPKQGAGNREPGTGNWERNREGRNC